MAAAQLKGVKCKIEPTQMSHPLFKLLRIKKVHIVIATVLFGTVYFLTRNYWHAFGVAFAYFLTSFRWIFSEWRETE